MGVGVYRHDPNPKSNRIPDPGSPRVDVLKQHVEMLKDLPSRMTSVDGRLTSVEAQIVQLRDETHREFSAMRQEITGRFDRQDTTFEELKRYMLMLHEDGIDRIARLRER